MIAQRPALERFIALVIPGSAGEGSGLGLAIVRAIAAQHSATVQLGEGDRGRGTRVSVSFPAAPAA